MGFETYEGSRTRGEPVDLYLFVYGPGATDYYAYTDAEEEQTVDIGAPYGEVMFVPQAIMRDTVKSSGTLDKAGLTVTTDRAADAAELFRVFPPTQIVSLFIRQGHANDPDSEFLVIWTGRILSCRFNHSQAEFTCEPIATSMRRSGLRRHYQYGCPHALYMGTARGGCRASKAAATRSTTVSALSGTTVTLPVGWNGAFDKLKFVTGMVEWTTDSGAVERRTIINVNAGTNVLALSGVVRNLVVTDPIDVLLGCDHQMDGDCKTLHDNLPDFGGQPWIPTKNPYGYYNNFY